MLGKYEVITWDMKKDIEVVTIYNNGFTSVYFLDNLLPHDLRFYIYGGSQTIHQYELETAKRTIYMHWVGKDEGDKVYYLPRTIQSRYSSHVKIQSGTHRHRVCIPTRYDTSQQGRKGRDQTLCR